MNLDPSPYALRRAGRERPVVELWSVQRLPFEPKGWLKEMRNELVHALRELSSQPDALFSAVYAARPSPMDADVENVLFYNVGAGCFAHLCSRSLRFERTYRVPAAPPVMLSSADALHYHRYGLVSGAAGFEDWVAARRLARWDAVGVPAVSSTTTAAVVWQAIASGDVETSGILTGREFGLRIELGAPPAARINLAVIVKPIVDGIVASMHAHDETNMDVIVSRLGQRLNVSPSRVSELLTDRARAVLGTRRLIWPWGKSVQWNPADDACVAVELRVREQVAGWSLSGELFEVVVARGSDPPHVITVAD